MYQMPLREILTKIRLLELTIEVMPVGEANLAQAQETLSTQSGVYTRQEGQPYTRNPGVQLGQQHAPSTTTNLLLLIELPNSTTGRIPASNAEY